MSTPHLFVGAKTLKLESEIIQILLSHYPHSGNVQVILLLPLVVVIKQGCEILFCSIEEDFVTWREKFWPAVCEHYNISAVGDDIRLAENIIFILKGLRSKISTFILAS